ncbi:MAG: hypothetical protein J5I98_05250 [Phaeodactylibacter sp.]|nr:hypothetical protein [Phaeodactylibacter sp.]
MRKIFVLLAAMLCMPPIVSSQTQSAETGDPPQPTLFEYFYRQDGYIPVLILETDWNRLINEKLQEEYQPGILSFSGPDGETVALQVSLRARGNARKKVCFFPPVKIKGDKKQLAGLGIAPGKKLKLVLPCGNGKADAECLLKEALAYQLYEVVYPVHHRTKVIQLEGWEDGDKKYSFQAFFVEDDKEFAERVKGKRIKEEKIRTVDLERDAYVKMSFFQYMIGNTDWSEPNSHNLQILELPGHEKLVPVPYDFDYAGFVDTDYAKPRSSLPIKDVEERFFLGKYVNEDEALACAQYYLSRKEQLLKVCRDFDLLREKSSRSIQEFVTDFFDLLEDEEKVLQAFVTRPTRRNQD